MSDTLQRFLIDSASVRGAVVRLDAVWAQLMQERDYPARVVALLGQMCVTAALLTDNLKQPGRLTLQMRGDGAVSLLVVDCNEALNVRCMAHHEETLPLGATDIGLLGQGNLLMSLDTAAMREPHQSTVPLTGATVAEVFEHYLHQSEQIDSRFFLAATDTGAAGLYLQRLPTSEGSDPDGWPRIEALASTVRAEELLGLAPEVLLTRLFHEEAVRVFEPRPIIHNFPQDWSKVRNMLLALGREEVYANVNEHGALIIHDELSNHRYRFTKPDIDTLFSHTPETPKSVH